MRSKVKRTDNTTKTTDTPKEHKATRPRGRKSKNRVFRRFTRLRDLSRHQKKKQIRVGLVMLVILTLIAGFVIWKDYHERPGILERSSLKAVDRGTDYITLEWKGTRNTDSYTVYYKIKGESPLGWHKIRIDNQKGNKDTVTLPNLDEGTEYGVVVRADNDERNGFGTKEKYFSTRTNQYIEGKTAYTKLTSSKDFTLELTASTQMTYVSDDEGVAEVNRKTGKVSINGSGTAVITVTAKETKDYLPAETEVTLEVIEAEPVSSAGAGIRIIYSLGPSNCEAVKAIMGDGPNADIPQSFDVTEDGYIVAYGMYDTASQRIITFDREGDGKNISVPDIVIGHPNGLAYSRKSGTAYCVKGGSGRAVTYKPATGEYGVYNFSHGGHALGYDRIEDCMYACSGGSLIMYRNTDEGFVKEHIYGSAHHTTSLYGQDCGGHAGIMMRCMSPKSDTHGTNYVDLYDMKHGMYLGTLSCELSEVESASVDDDGYLLLLGNTTDYTDYIWKTPINIEDIGAGLED